MTRKRQQAARKHHQNHPREQQWQGTMDEPLLSPSDRRASSSGAPAAAAPSSPSSRQLIPHAPFSLDAFVRFVLASWAALLHGLSACLRALLGAAGAAGAPRLSLVQAQRLEDLQAKLAEPYDPACAAHREQLRELWRLAFPGEPLPASAAAADASSPSSLASPRWRDAGFQGDDPRTDFRGAGLAGLDHLLYLGTRHPALFETLLRKTRGARSSWEYPFACAGLNLTFTLADVLGLGAHAAGAGGGGAAAAAAAPPPGALPATPAGRAFLALLAESDAAFEELYCAAFDRLDRLWLERRASYMEFNSVLKQLRGEVDAALRARPATLAALRAALLSNGGGGRKRPTKMAAAAQPPPEPAAATDDAAAASTSTSTSDFDPRAPRFHRTVVLADGRTVAASVCGSDVPNARPVLFLHPIQGNRFMALSLHKTAVRHNLRIVAFDRPGVGGSTWPPPPPAGQGGGSGSGSGGSGHGRRRAVADYAADVAELARLLPGLLPREGFALLAMSAGAMYALSLALSAETRHLVRGAVTLLAPWVPHSSRRRGPSAPPEGFLGGLLTTLGVWAPPPLLRLAVGAQNGAVARRVAAGARVAEVMTRATAAERAAFAADGANDEAYRSMILEWGRSLGGIVDEMGLCLERHGPLHFDYVRDVVAAGVRVRVLMGTADAVVPHAAVQAWAAAVAEEGAAAATAGEKEEEEGGGSGGGGGGGRGSVELVSVEGGTHDGLIHTHKEAALAAIAAEWDNYSRLIGAN